MGGQPSSLTTMLYQTLSPPLSICMDSDTLSVNLPGSLTVRTPRHQCKPEHHSWTRQLLVWGIKVPHILINRRDNLLQNSKQLVPSPL